MTADRAEYTAALDAAARHARCWLDSVPTRPVPPRADPEAMLAALGGELPDKPGDPAEVVDALAAAMDAGLMDIASGRFYGWVMGGTLPAALAADWLVSAWDQNTGMRKATPGTATAEEVAGHWLLDLLGLPAGSDVGFVTGATMANFTCLAAAREKVLREAGWDVSLRGLFGAPPVRVVVGAERHDSVDVALRYLGFGAPHVVGADDQGRIAVAEIAAALGDGPAILCLQAGNVHSGAFDDFAAAIPVARSRGAWVHIDGAFGLWAGASTRARDLVAGYQAADSWGTDAHKTLNVPYDCGIAIVADPAPLRAAMSVHASYLIPDAAGDPLDKVPEMSRRARGVPVWAALRSLGRAGVADLVDGLIANARKFADAVAEVPGVEVLNDVGYTQVCLAVGDGERTRAVTQRVLADGTAWMSGSRWRGRDIIRVSMSNWSTDADDLARSVDALRRAVEATA
jgi:glutamate/tyrosine decarboxylase-like PLP-dependent enzyme